MYLQTITYEGTDWHDICTDTEQISICNDPLFYDVESAISDMMIFWDCSISRMFGMMVVLDM